nr:hypothetical protein [Tanacetum cinerariifolium]
TSSTANDSPVDNVFSDTNDFDHHTSNVVQDCMDVDKNVLEQQNFSRKNLFDEFEQKVSSNNLINHEALEEPNVEGKKQTDEEDQQFSAKKLDVQ